MSVALIGFKGCGKSTIGPLLARRMGFSFEDLDHLIERAYFGKTGARLGFRKIFEKEGEAFFRAMEGELLRERSGRADLVLALGGGTPMAPEAASLLAAFRVVYLRAPADAIIERARAGGWPAYLAGAADPEAALRLLFEERAPRYEALADFIVENARAPEEVAGEIFARMRAARPAPGE